MEIEIHQLPESLKLNIKTLKKKIRAICDDISLNAKSVTVVFVTDDYLTEMHAHYLNDPDKTDVITFNLGDDEIEGEIYISHERAGEHAGRFGVSFDEEVFRLIIHGLLHLAGFNDLEDEQRVVMKESENSLLNKYYTRI